MKISFVIPSLHTGGAERQLTALARGLAGCGHAVSVLVFAAGGALEADLAGTGVRLIDLEKHGRFGLPATVGKLLSHAREEKPDVLHGYLPVPNILCSAAAPFLGPVKVVLGVRASYMDLSRYGLASRVCYWLEARLARLAHGVISNSRAGLEHFMRKGVRIRHGLVVHNGIDTDRFRPDPDGGAALRSDWGVSPDRGLVGMAGRLDAMKDHPSFLRAAARAAARDESLRFVCVGGGPKEYADRLRAMGRELGLGDKLKWAGEVRDMRAAYSAMDMLCLSSTGEGFPNVVAEAMSCGVPCVSTDVGDVGELLGDTGIMAPLGDEMRLSGAILEMAEQARRGHKETLAPGAAARERILEHFTLDKLVTNTENALKRIVTG